MRGDLNKNADELRRAYPKPVEKDKNMINLVLFVASGLEEPPENLMKAVRDAARNKYRGMQIL